MTSPSLEFLTNEAGEKEGLGDAGIETFRNAPYASAARESGQNSRDAEVSLPVKLTFEVLDVPAAQIPAYYKLAEALESCSKSALQDKEREFFGNALAVVRGETIPVLRIADYNTKGLTGPPDQAGTPFHSLLKSLGVSTKDSETSGGSFGIGKNASFAVSDLQMVMYSTTYVDEAGNSAFAAQGKIKLVSHSDAGGVERRATGYWGNPEKYTAVTDPALVPEWLRRKDRGTSIFCVGFRKVDGWAALMTSALVTNFFCAVYRGEMVFEVASGEYEVNANTVEALLANDTIRTAAEQSGQRQDLEFSEQLYRCLVSASTEEHLINVSGLGDVRVRILVAKGLPRRIGFIRNGMYITDSLHRFGHPFKRFPSSRDFVALVEPVGGESERLMKRLENPAHDELSAERILDPGKRKGAEAAMRKLGTQLRELIKERTAVEYQEAVVLDELGKFFAQPEKGDRKTGDEGESDPERYRVTPPKRRPVRKSTPKPVPGASGGGGTGSGGGGGGGTGPETGGGSGGRGRRSPREPLSLTDVRNTIRYVDGEPARRKIYFTPDVDGTIALVMEATGVNDSVNLRLAGADKGEVKDGLLLLNISKGDRCAVDVVLTDPYDGPIEVVAVEAPNSGDSA